MRASTVDRLEKRRERARRALMEKNRSLVRENARLSLVIAAARKKYADLSVAVLAGIYARQESRDTDRRIFESLEEDAP